MTTVVVNDKVAETKTEEQTLVQVPRRKKTAVTVPADAAPMVVHAEPIIAPTVEAGRFVQLTQEVVQLNRDMMLNGYKMGLRLKAVRDEKLFTFGGFENFEAYCESIHVSFRYSERLIKVAEQYTEEDFLDVGVKKLILILEARPEQRQHLLDQAKGGASRREIERQITSENKAPQRQAENQIGQKTNTPITPSEKRITMVTREGLFAHALKDRVTDKPATIESLKTQPAYAVIVHENQTEQLVVVYIDENTNELKLKVACKKTK